VAISAVLRHLHRIRGCRFTRGVESRDRGVERPVRRVELERVLIGTERHDQAAVVVHTETRRVVRVVLEHHVRQVAGGPHDLETGRGAGAEAPGAGAVGEAGVSALSVVLLVHPEPT